MSTPSMKMLPVVGASSLVEDVGRRAAAAAEARVETQLGAHADPTAQLEALLTHHEEV